MAEQISGHPEPFETQETTRPTLDGAGSAPMFSVVVPVFNVHAYLSACLDSILGQSYADFEVIAVDDASTDESPALLDTYAAVDSRITVCHLPANVGLGAARNLGIDRARGSYLMFVDSDDMLADGAIEAVAARISATGEPDVVQFGFARLWADGRTEVDVGARWLTPEAELDPRFRPDLLELFPSAWNKAYRRDFVEKHGFRFADGFYEDIPWTYPVLITANRVATLDRACYLYRQRTTGNILGTSGARHFDLFSQYDLVFAYLDAHPETEWWRPRLVDRLTRHVPAVLEEAGRIPPQSRRDFFHAASVSFRSHRPRGYLPTGGVAAKLKVLLIERDGYRLFRLAQFVNFAKRRLLPRRP